jgi:hypothetical protein
MRSRYLTYWIRTTFMLQGVRVRVSGRVGALFVVVVGKAQTGGVAFVWS